MLRHVLTMLSHFYACLRHFVYLLADEPSIGDLAYVFWPGQIYRRDSRIRPV